MGEEVSLIESLSSVTSKQLRPIPAEHPADWAAREIDYKRAPSYDTPYKGPFDPDLLPFWRQPLADSVDDNIREVVVCKCSRAGGSENFLLTRLRYGIATMPAPTMYITADMEAAERFMQDRIVRGMDLSPTLSGMLSRARQTEHAVRFEAMDLRLMWSRNKGAYKQDGYELILADEVSTWPSFAADMLRKRADMYPFHHILFISSPDPARKGDPTQDPIVILYDDTDKRKWFMPDPGGKGDFFFRFGDGKTDGLVIPQGAKREDGTWDLDKVRAETFYKTLACAEIRDDSREDLMRAGRWVPTATGHRDDVTGYHITAPMIPTRAGDFGELASRFLAAKYHLNEVGGKKAREHSPVRVYFSEYWSEPYREEQVTVEENALEDREQDYGAGEVFLEVDGAQYGVAITVDVQKFHLWYVARVWSVDGNKTSSALLDWGTLPSFSALHDKVAEVNPSVIGIDIGYAMRASEVGDFCAEHTDQMHPKEARVYALRGNDTQAKNIIELTVRDALEGRSHGQRLFSELSWQTDVFRTWLVEMMSGLGSVPWYVCRGLTETREGQEYIRQVTSTRKVDGIWIPPKHGQDHLFDCEAMQLVLARSDGLI